MSEETSEDSPPLLHVYGQHFYHGPAMLRGNRQGLLELYMALRQALDTSHGVATVFAIDGEGYPLEIQRVNLQASMGEPEYLYMLEWSQASAAREREERLRMSVHQATQNPVMDKMRVALRAALRSLSKMEGEEATIKQIEEALR